MGGAHVLPMHGHHAVVQQLQKLHLCVQAQTQTLWRPDMMQHGQVSDAGSATSAMFAKQAIIALSTQIGSLDACAAHPTQGRQQQHAEHGRLHLRVHMVTLQTADLEGGTREAVNDEAHAISLLRVEDNVQQRISHLQYHGDVLDLP